MVSVRYRHVDGTVQVVEAVEGRSVMQAAVAADVEGIVAECGGNLMCATCHVYVDEPYLGMLPRPSESEDEMLDMTVSERRDSSRLSCQLHVTGALDGLTVELPESQT